MKKLSVYFAIILIVILLFGFSNILKGMLFKGNGSNYASRMHLNTGNTTRIMGKSHEDIGIGISRIIYPSTDDRNKPNGIILVQSYDWKELMCVLNLGREFRCPIIPIGDDLTPGIITFIKEASPKGIGELGGTEVLVIARSDSLENKLRAENIKTRLISYKDLDGLQKNIYSLFDNITTYDYGFILDEDSPLMSIPVSPWIASHGGHLLFSKNNNLTDFSKSILTNNKLKKVYLIGNKVKLQEDIFDKNNIEVEKITAKAPERLAVNFAQFYDFKTGIGFGANMARKDTNHNYILSSVDNPAVSIISSQLSRGGNAGPMLITKSDKLSKDTENYLWKMKPAFYETPAEGPYINLWVIGDDNFISYRTQAMADYAVEIQPYETMGEQGTSGLEVIAILLVLSSLCGALWAAIHMCLRMKHLTILNKLMWILTILVLGPFGIWLYVISYKDRPYMMIYGVTMWKRPLWNQAAVSTIMELSFGASAMIALGFLMSSQGLNLVPFYRRFGLFLLGQPLIIQMIGGYIFALILNGFVFMPVMVMEMRMLPYRKALKKSLPIAFVSITSLSIGMMISMWYLNMVYLPIMPEEYHVLWWGVMQVSTLIGGLIAYIPNWQLVRYGKKMGTA